MSPQLSGALRRHGTVTRGLPEFFHDGPAVVASSRNARHSLILPASERWFARGRLRRGFGRGATMALGREALFSPRFLRFGVMSYRKHVELAAYSPMGDVVEPGVELLDQRNR